MDFHTASAMISAAKNAHVSMWIIGDGLELFVYFNEFYLKKKKAFDQRENRNRS